jgi:hypothetical protein
MAARGRLGRVGVPTALLCGGLLGCVIAAVLSAGSDKGGQESLSIVLAIAAFVAGYTVVVVGGVSSVSASFIVVLLAAAFLGPTSACLAAVIAEVAATMRVKTRR